MKNLIFIFFTISGFSKVIHEEPPFFIENFPIIMKILLTEKENPSKVQVFYKSVNEFQSITMECSDKMCKTVIPAQNSSFQYFVRFNQCSGKKIETAITTIYELELPKWQKDIADDYITIFGDGTNFKGFSHNKIIFKGEQTEEKDFIEKKSWFQQLFSWDSDEKKIEKSEVLKEPIDEKNIEIENYSNSDDKIFTP